MPFVPTENVARVLIQRGDLYTIAYNNLRFQFDSALTSSRLSALNAAIRLWWFDYVKYLQFSGSQFGFIRSRDETNEGGLEVNLYPPNSTYGAGSTGLPANDALVCTFLTGNVGRSRRGRFYLGHLDASRRISGNPSNVQAAFVTDYLAAFGALNGYVAGIGGSPYHVVVSWWADSVLRDAGLVSEVTSYAANTRLDSQRRRLRVTWPNL